MDIEIYKKIIFVSGTMIFFQGARDFILLDKNLQDSDESIREYAEKLRDNQQINEIRYYTSQHASLKNWKDTRFSKSPANYHNIDYHKLFEEQK